MVVKENTYSPHQTSFQAGAFKACEPRIPNALIIKPKEV